MCHNNELYFEICRFNFRPRLSEYLIIRQSSENLRLTCSDNRGCTVSVMQLKEKSRVSVVFGILTNTLLFFINKRSYLGIQESKIFLCWKKNPLSRLNNWNHWIIVFLEEIEGHALNPNFWLPLPPSWNLPKKIGYGERGFATFIIWLRGFNFTRCSQGRDYTVLILVSTNCQNTLVMFQYLFLTYQ